MSSEDFEYLSAKYGPMDLTAPVPADFASRMAGRLPRSLIDFVSINGFGLWRRGRFQFCDPDIYSEILDFVTRNDPEISVNDCEIFGFTSFGILLVWSRTYQNVLVKLYRGEIEAPKITSDQKTSDDIAIAANLYSIDSDSFDQFDHEGKSLFARATKKLGPLALGECFGFVPALSFGGSATLENVRKQPALAHFGFLAQSTGFRLMDYSKRPAYVRDIG